MESLAYLVMGILAFILALAIAAVILSVLSWSGKINKAWGFASTGMLLLVTIAAYSLQLQLGMLPTIPLLVSIGFLAFKKKAN
jgi:hypothetical protein